MNTDSILLIVLALAIWLLLFWNLMLRSEVAELRRQIHKLQQWRHRELEKNQERI